MDQVNIDGLKMFLFIMLHVLQVVPLVIAMQIIVQVALMDTTYLVLVV